MLNERQTRWIMKLISFNFIINHKSKKINFVDALSKRFDYYNEKNTELYKLLLTLQKKLQMIETFRVVSTSKYYVICVSIKYSVNSSFNVKNEILKFENDICESIKLFKKIQTIINDNEQYVFRYIASIITTEETAFDKNSNFMLNFIKILQIKNFWMIEKRQKLKKSIQHHREQSITSAWNIDIENIWKHFKWIYISIETLVRAKLLRRHHDDELTEHFETEKTLKLFVRKYYWSNINIYVKSYVNICEICQRTKTPRHRFYETLQSLFQSNDSWKKIIMNFITDFSSKKT